MELINLTSLNIVGLNLPWGVFFAVFAVLVGTRITVTGVRGYIFILTLAILVAASVVEHWFADSSVTTQCLIGFSVGFIADDVYLNLSESVPDFVKDIFTIASTGVKNKVKKFLNVK